jgi:hypothetical protein
MVPTKQKQVRLLGRAQARNLQPPLGSILLNLQGVPRMYCYPSIQRTSFIPLWFPWLHVRSMFNIHVFFLDCRPVLSVVDNSSKEQVLVALAVTLGEHILCDHISCEIRFLVICEFNLVRARIKDWIGMCLSQQGPI